MLVSLNLVNFAILETSELSLHKGMTAITGETGAGKSVALYALQLALGARADAQVLRTDCAQASISATFDLTGNTSVQHWLTQHQFPAGDRCVLQRIMAQKGRSRAKINGVACSLATLQRLGQQLISVHQQHDHHSLTQARYQSQRLDQFGALEGQAATVHQHWQQWRHSQRQRQALEKQQLADQAKQQLLNYQCAELSELAPQADELEALESEQKKLSQTDSLLHNCQQLQDLCEHAEPHNLFSLLHRSQQLLEELGDFSEIASAQEMLNSAQIQVSEMLSTVNHFGQGIESDPERLYEVEQRLSQFYQLARKHQVSPGELPQLLEQLQQALAAITHNQQAIIQWREQEQHHWEHYYQQAKTLSKGRLQAAEELSEQVSAQLAALGMPCGQFVVQCVPVEDNEPGASGQEQAVFMVTTNPDQPLAPLAKAASGGELSRICLAIEAVSGQKSTLATLVFDEIDSGVGGGTAERVGRVLQQLATAVQVICVTHQPQVAACADHHLHIKKSHEAGKTLSRITALAHEAQVQEVARMLGGIQITQQTLSHAREMIESAGPSTADLGKA